MQEQVYKTEAFKFQYDNTLSEIKILETDIKLDLNSNMIIL